MAILIAIGHIVGALIALMALGIGLQMLGMWESDRNRKFALQEISLALGIPVTEIDKPEHESRVFQFAATKFSSELLRNRLSDLCAWVQTGWGWLSTLLQVGALIGVIWYAVTDDISNTVHAWWIIAVAFFFWLSSVLFALACKLLTGRFPGQARQARKMLAEVVEQRSLAIDEAHCDMA
jgi:hypothetical protein